MTTKRDANAEAIVECLAPIGDIIAVIITKLPELGDTGIVGIVTAY